MNLFLVGGLVGGVGAAGLVLAVLASPPLRHRTLADRIAPYLADSTRTSQLLLRSQPNTVSALGRLTAPLLADAVKMIDRIVGGQSSVRRRLDALDSPMTVEQFRVDQVLWGAIATAAGLALGLIAVIFGQTNPITLVLLIVACAIGGVLGRDWWLSQVVAKRDAEILTEFPVVAEMLALAVTAGEGPAGAIERISRLAHGHLVNQLSSILARHPFRHTATGRAHQSAGPHQPGTAVPVPRRHGGGHRTRHPTGRCPARPGRRRPGPG